MPSMSETYTITVKPSPRPGKLTATSFDGHTFTTPMPLLDGALECVRAGFIPGGLKNNRDFAECLVEYDDGVPEDVRALLFDPQTAGGLLISTPDPAKSAVAGTTWC